MVGQKLKSLHGRAEEIEFSRIYAKHKVVQEMSRIAKSSIGSLHFKLCQFDSSVSFLFLLVAKEFSHWSLLNGEICLQLLTQN